MNVIEIVKEIEELINEITSIAEEELEPIFEYCLDERKAALLRDLIRAIDTHTAVLWEKIANFYDTWKNLRSGIQQDG